MLNRTLEITKCTVTVMDKLRSGRNHSSKLAYSRKGQANILHEQHTRLQLMIQNSLKSD